MEGSECPDLELLRQPIVPIPTLVGRNRFPVLDDQLFRPAHILNASLAAAAAAVLVHGEAGAFR